MSEMLTETQLDTESGGNAIDRGILISTMKEQGFGKYLEPGGDNEAILKNTCRKYGIGYRAQTITFIKGKLGIE